MPETKNKKTQDLLTKIKDCLNKGNYRLTKHALERNIERGVSLPDILEVLRNGYHEKIKDKWDEVYKAWNYAIRGKTIDDESCRVIVSFEENGLLVITVIRIE